MLQAYGNASPYPETGPVSGASPRTATAPHTGVAVAIHWWYKSSRWVHARIRIRALLLPVLFSFQEGYHTTGRAMISLLFLCVVVYDTTNISPVYIHLYKYIYIVYTYILVHTQQVFLLFMYTFLYRVYINFYIIYILFFKLHTYVWSVRDFFFRSRSVR